MTPLFGKKAHAHPDERTVLILDIENGSAATALLRLSPNEQPKLFGELRAYTPLPMTRSGETLSAEVEKAIQAVLRNAAEVSARVRNHKTASSLGHIDSIAVFMAPPWGTPNLAEGKPTFLESMKSYVKRATERTFGRQIPAGFYTSAGSVAFGTRALMSKEPCLVCAVTGEVTELLRMDKDGVAAHATVPTGLHTYMRTLRTHGGLSESESRSAMRLPHDASHLREPSRYAAREFAAHVHDAARDLLAGTEVMRVAIVAPEHSSERMARALVEYEALQELFPKGGEVRALRASHATPHIAAHAESPDLHLLLGALFVDSHFNN